MCIDFWRFFSLCLDHVFFVLFLDSILVFIHLENKTTMSSMLHDLVLHRRPLPISW